MPLHVVDEDRQGAVDAGGIGCGHEGQRPLLQDELLQGFAAIAAPERLRAGLAVSCGHHVSVNFHSGAREAVGEAFGEFDERVRLVAGKPRRLRAHSLGYARQH